MEEGSEGTADSMPPLETVDAAAANPNSQSDDGVQSESQKSPEEVPEEVPEVQKVPEDVPDDVPDEEHLAADNMEAVEDEGNIDEEMQEDDNVGVQEVDDSDQGDQTDHDDGQGDQATQDLEGPHGSQEVGEQDAASD